MIDEAKLESISLNPHAIGQRIVGTIFLVPNYNFPGRRTRIILEGIENIPRDRGVVFVMNHTDRYNYWPFQYRLWRDGIGFTAPWVKGKYYENPLVEAFLDACNNIPVPSKGYILTKDFQRVAGRIPSDPEYAALKRYLDGELPSDEAARQGGAAVAKLLASGDYAEDLERRYERMMGRVVELSEDALSRGLHILIFPQGTRSLTLLRGHTGAAQFILHARATVVPVGCNGSERCYPGSSPWSRGGKVVYRIGKPMTPEGDLRPFLIHREYRPFTNDAREFEPIFRKVTDLMMDRINDLLDPEYRYADESERATGAKRFV